MAALVNALEQAIFGASWTLMPTKIPRKAHVRIYCEWQFSPLDKVMAKEKTRGEESSAIGKQTTAHAYSATDYYFDHLKKTIASAPSGGTEFEAKVKACAEQNISATQEYVRELTYAKDIQDILRIQMEFVRSQLEAFGEQANSLGEAYIKVVSGQTRKSSPPDK
jgi:hypothetical protein